MLITQRIITHDIFNDLTGFPPSRVPVEKYYLFLQLHLFFILIFTAISAQKSCHIDKEQKRKEGVLEEC